jgi:hypothetical protein
MGGAVGPAGGDDAGVTKGDEALARAAGRGEGELAAGPFGDTSGGDSSGGDVLHDSEWLPGDHDLAEHLDGDEARRGGWVEGSVAAAAGAARRCGASAGPAASTAEAAAGDASGGQRGAIIGLRLRPLLPPYTSRLDPFQRGSLGSKAVWQNALVHHVADDIDLDKEFGACQS